MGSLASAAFVVTDVQGKPLASSLHATPAELPMGDVVADRAEQVTLGPERLVAGKPYFHTSMRLTRGPRSGDPAVLHILFPCGEYDAAWRAAFLPPLAVGLIAVVAVVLVTHLVARRISRVASRLATEVRRIVGGDFTRLEPPAWNDETRDLAIAVNQTAARLADYEREIRRTEQLRTVALLGAGLAHEMRNAATGCRMAVDLHAEACGTGGGDESLVVAKRQLVLMESRLQRFLQLGKEPAELEKREIDLGATVEELVELIRPAARHAGVELVWRPGETGATVRADRELLGQAIVNLVLNALEAAQKQRATTGEDGHVLLMLTHADGLAELEVCDSGAGPEGNLAAGLFEPFVTSKAEGIGLGLAVARQVVCAHGGTIDWSRRDGLTRFRIRLPIAAEEPSHV
jgi:signal transduction histidine kinase